MAVRTETDVRGELQRLLETVHDREEGYRVAQDGVKNPELKRVFRTYAERSAQLARELEDLIRQHGGKTKERGSVTGAAFRGWMQIKATVTSHDEAAILSECERGEDVAVDHYRKALAAGLPEDITSVIERQSAEIEQGHSQIRNLRDAAKERHKDELR